MQPKPRPARDRVNENKLQQIMRKGSGLSGRRVICSRPDRSAGALRSHRMNRAISAFRRSRRDSPSSDRRRRDQGCSAYLIAASSSQPTINRRLRTGPDHFWAGAKFGYRTGQCGSAAGLRGRQAGRERTRGGGTPGTRSCSLHLSSDRTGWHALGTLFRFESIRLGRIPPAVEPVKIGIVVLRHAVLN